MPENRLSSLLQTSSHVLVVGAGLVYLFGFTIVSVFDASYGIADFSLIRTKVIAVGCLFASLLALPIVVTFRTFHIFGLERERISPPPRKKFKPENRPYRIADVALSLPFVCCGVIAIPIGFLFRTPLLWSDKGFWLFMLMTGIYIASAVWSRDKFDGHPILFVGLSFLISTAFFVVLYKYADRGLFWFVMWLSAVCFVTVAIWYWMRSPEEIRTTEWERLFLFLVPVIFGIYATKLYPRIKPQFGGGEPVPIVLHLTKKLPVFTSDSVPVSLVDETEQGYYVLRDGDKAIFVARGLVEEVEFLRSGQTAPPIPAKP